MTQNTTYPLSMLTILRIYEAIVTYFNEKGDPISPSGVKDMNLLESAVARQLTGIGNVLKYPDPYSSAATLMYGLCMNHPFHNGNKRLALVAGIIHLDKNGYILVGVSHDELYHQMLTLAAHKLSYSSKTPKGGYSKIASLESPRLTSDEEVMILRSWIREKTRKLDKHEHPLKIRELRRILKRFGYLLGDPQHNTAPIYKITSEKQRKYYLFGEKKEIERRAKLTEISCPNEGTVVNINTIKMIRHICKLTVADGIDSRAFYDTGAVIDSIINEYRFVLDRLSKR